MSFVAEKRTTVVYPVTDLELHGAQHQLLELVRGLDKGRFKPIVINLKPGSPMEPYFRELPDVQIISLKRRGRYDFLFLFKMLRVLRELKADVLQPFLTPATFFSLLPALLCRDIVKIVTERSVQVTNNTSLGHRLYLKTENYLKRFADRAVANSQAGREYLIGQGIHPSQTAVIYNGIDLSNLTCSDEVVQEVRQKLNLFAEEKVVGMIARMFPVKRFDVFLNAAAIVNRVIPDAKFVLMGEGPLRSHIAKLSRELHLDSKVIFTGEQQDVVPYLSNFDIFVLSSDTEGLSLAICEAMALGKPVVATNVGGNKELVADGRTGFLVPPENPETLAKAIIRLLRDPELAQAMGQRAREKVVTQLGLKRYVDEYQSLYEETLERKRQRKPRRQP